MKVAGYTECSFGRVQEIMKLLNKQKDLTAVQIASNIELKSTTPIKEAFSKKEQSVSDRVFSLILAELRMTSFVLWIAGERRYYVANKHLK